MDEGPPAERVTPTRWQAERLERHAEHARGLRSWLAAPIRVNDADVERLREGLTRGDPLADAFVRWAEERPPGQARRCFDEVVEHGLHDDCEGPLRAWFESLAPPPWLDPDLLRLGAHVSRRPGLTGVDVLISTALMGGYRSQAAVKPLAVTGALDAMVVRRIGETSRFVLDVFESDGMAPSSAGFKSACRVRLTHALVRRNLQRRPDWDHATWGVPINQSDMAGTLLEFSIAYLLGLMMLGFRFRPRERDAVMHLWRYVGHVMGVDDDLVPRNFGEGLRQLEIQTLTNPHADADSRALARALHQLPSRMATSNPEWVRALALQRYRTAVSRFTLGAEVADDIGLPAAPLHRLLLGVGVARFGCETIRRVLPGSDARVARRGLSRQRSMVERMIGSERLDYAPYGSRRSMQAG